MQKTAIQTLDPNTPKKRIQIVLHEDDADAFTTLAHCLEWTPSELGRRAIGQYVETARKHLKSHEAVA